MTILSRASVEQRLRARDKRQLIVTPLLSKRQIGAASVDVRLGNEFLLPTRVLASSHDYKLSERGISALYRPTRRDFKSPLYVHPNQFVLGATLEFVGLPDDVSCYVIGRSSLGRTGLVIATATAVAPGYRGCITLEIVNIGEVPLPIYPGMRIAQLVFHKSDGNEHYSGRYKCPIGPEPPMLHRDVEMTVWSEGQSTAKCKTT
ncbi:MAG: dCTP deaminase [Thermoanaerobaculia bacterium]|jgi:dCTP deaminase|nr:dCTP deaminase [Thermoanaerobaculia bacterium]